jgi:flavin-dependent dehydrogenase
LRHRLAPGLDPGRHAARVVYTARGTPPGQAALRFLPGGEGYAWDFPRPGNHSIGVAVPAGKLQRAQLDRLIEDLRRKEGATGGGTYHGALLTTWNWRAGRLESLGGTRHAILGDAAGLADPVTGEGIDYALRSARLAAETFHEDSGFSAYPVSVQGEFADDHRRAQAIRRWFYHPAIVQHLVSAARHSAMAIDLLHSLADAMNEHLPVGRTVRRGIISSLHGSGVSG